MSHFIDARCWLDDDDNKHVWLRHKCIRGEVDTMLPWPTWRAVGTEVRPSIACADCDLHVMARIEAAPHCLVPVR